MISFRQPKLVETDILHSGGSKRYKKRRQRAVTDDLLYDEQMPHNRNPLVQQVQLYENNQSTPPPLPPRQSRGAENYHFNP